MESFTANDKVVLRYVDTALTDPEAVKKEVLVLVRLCLFLRHSHCFRILPFFHSNQYFSVLYFIRYTKFSF
jgi:hypothetical protein